MFVIYPTINSKGLSCFPIDYGVYEGRFEIPLAAALSHAQKAGVLMRTKDMPAALSEAQQAETLARESAIVNATMGRALDANGRAEEARAYYQKALTLAKNVEPKFQIRSVAGLEERLGAKQKWTHFL